MNDSPTVSQSAATTPEQEMAAALDAALNALQAGQPLDRPALLGRFPALASALDLLEQLFGSATDLQPPVTPGPSLPERIGPYRVERQLGAGSFGVVYLGHDPDVRRCVAIKVLHDGRLDQPEALERFRREACVIARLRHPAIVQLFDYSRQGPPYYLVTEFVEGVDPRNWCQTRACDVKERAGLVARIADAVDYAHQQGVWHRDLKPGNILIDEGGSPHILDFGLARLEEWGGQTQPAATEEGHILGSLPYMPPEQAAGHSHSADARSDVYSLGVVLYELLAGRLPFLGPAHALPARVIEDLPPPPSRWNGAIPPDLEAVCLKALAKKPADRYPSAADLASDLRAFSEGRPVLARRPGALEAVRRFLDRRHLDTLRRGWPLLLLLLGVVIFAGCALTNYWEVRRDWPAMILTKLVQVALMLGLAVRLRPMQEGEPLAAPGWLTSFGVPMSAAERQIWALVPAYYGAFLTLLILNQVLEQPIPVAPMLAVLSGMAFSTLGATIWGWFYVWGAAFFALAVLIVPCQPYGLTLLGLGWLVCLVAGSVHLHWTR